MNNRLPWDIAAADADVGTAAPAAGIRPGRRLIAVMLLTAAALDLTRCGLVLTTARYPAPATGLVAAGLATAALSMRTARGCQGGRRWAGWAALLIGATSAPEAAASGFHAPYTIPDTATAALGVLLTVAVLATAGLTGQPGHDTGNACAIDLGGHPVTRGAAAPAQTAMHSSPPRTPGPVSSRTSSAGCACTVTGRARTAQSASISKSRATRNRAGDRRA
jgi:hypothetical protein